MRKRVRLTVIATMLAMAVTNCSQEKPTTAQPQPLTSLHVRLTWLHQSQFAGLYLAADKGFYREAGLNVVLKPGGIEYPSIKMVSVGQDEVGMTSADQI